jgi:hypothetical protein
MNSADGHASVGDKTILDALIPMAETVLIKYKESKDIRISYK